MQSRRRMQWIVLWTLTAFAGGGYAFAAEPKMRTFRFTYAVTVSGFKPGKTARIWLPVPSCTEDQIVRILCREAPAGAVLRREPKWNNRMLFAEAPAGADGTINLKLVCRITRFEVKADLQGIEDDGQEPKGSLQADAKVPVAGKPLELLEGRKLPADQLAAARELYDLVNRHMRYSKEGTGWGQGDAVWACESGFGNCSDFHSLFISLARSQKIPAVFEIGFPLPEKRGSGDIPGYHCWAKFKPNRMGWVPVDISEANKNPKLRDYYFGNLTEHRVTFSTGRDLDLVPKQAGPPLNFFIYPYVEVDGKPYPAEKVRKQFAYQDVTAE